MILVKSQLKGINKVRKKLSSGVITTYYYHRASGKRLTGNPNSPEFAISYAEAEKSSRDKHTGKFAGLFLQYIMSIEFNDLAETTKASYKRSLQKAEVHFGTMPVEALNDPRVKSNFMQWRSDVARDSGKREADHRLSAVSAMISWAVENGKVNVNHIKGFKRLYHSDRTEILWEEDDITKFMSHSSLEMQQALMLAVHTGLRQGDILHLPWSNYDGTHLTVRIRKNRRNGVQAKPTRIPCTKALRDMLDRMERKSTTILTTPSGRPYEARNFRRSWQLALEGSGLGSSNLHFNDLRGTAITMLASAGCTVPEIVSITGHKLASATKILEHYLARTSQLAGGAITRFENATATKFANQLQTKAPSKRA